MTRHSGCASGLRDGTRAAIAFADAEIGSAIAHPLPPSPPHCESLAVAIALLNNAVSAAEMVIVRCHFVIRPLDEKVVELHLEKLGVKMTKLSQKQADYIGVPINGAVQAGSLSVLIVGERN